MQGTSRNKPEVMSPAGYWPQLHSAIEAGADAVYFGLRHFTARGKVGFRFAELADVMRTLHRRSVRGYLTFNTLVFDHELQTAADAVGRIASAGVDAIIVQDLGMARLAKQIAPQLSIHGSTQMSITSAEGVALAQKFGVERVVLARELSLDDIRAIRAQTDCQLEMFVHGALCVSYSGQCFSSEAWGGRSANRGQCAQACRLPYEMFVDGEIRPLGSARYLLSPEDLYALREIPEIVTMGISSLKIEGRYKDENYVALATRAYRKAVDEAWSDLPLSVSQQEELQLSQVYSRGLGPHFLRGTNHQAVVPGRSPRHRGLMMGRVTEVGDNCVLIKPEVAHSLSPLKAGDGLVFDAADWRSPEEPEEGGRVYEVTTVGNQLRLRFANNAVDFRRLRLGDWVWRTHDPEVDKTARTFTKASAPVRKQPIRTLVIARVGRPLSMEWSIEGAGILARVESEAPLVPSQTRPATVELMKDQLGRLGNTPYVLSDVEAVIEGSPFVPSSLLNDMRRRAVVQLERLQSQAAQVVVNNPAEVLHAASRSAVGVSSSGSRFVPRVHLLVRTAEQLDAAIVIRPDSVTLDYLDLYGLRPAVEQLQAFGITARVASPHVLKPNEQRIVAFLLGLNCDIVVRSTGLLEALASEKQDRNSSGSPVTNWIGDFSLNASNVLTSRAFLDYGLQRLTPTHDLNAAQVADLARNIGPDRLEVIAYQHLPVFHTEHCVFCRFLSSGTSYEDCGHPCEKHRVALRDPDGRAHPVMADVGCRNTVFGAQAQEASQHLQRWRDAGIEHYRLEFVHETSDQVTQVTQAFIDALKGNLSGASLRSRLQHLSPQGTTEGSLFVPENYLEVPNMG